MLKNIFQRQEKTTKINEAIILFLIISDPDSWKSQRLVRLDRRADANDIIDSSSDADQE